MSGRVERKLAAILAADVAGYSRLMGIDEEGTLAALKTHRRELIDPKIAEHHGRIVKTTGDGLLIEFASVVDAVRCAVDVQQGMTDRNAGDAPERRIDFRVGINIGDIIIDGEDIYGDGVNIAARLEALAAPGEIWVSSAVQEQVRDKLDFAFEDMGAREVKNIARPISVHRIRHKGEPASQVGRFASGTSRKRLSGRASLRFVWLGVAGMVLVASALGGWLALRPGSSMSEGSRSTARASIAVLPFINMSGDTGQDYFSDGLTEDILTELARVPGFFVPARTSTSHYKGASPDVKKVGAELRVRYVLEGSVQRSEDRVRVTAQLIEAATSSEVWAQRYDRPLKDIFSVQDEITEAIATRLVSHIRHEDLEIAKRKPTERMDAYDLVLQGRENAALSSAEGFARAKALFEKAISLDPNYADGYAGLSQVYTAGFIYNVGEVTGPEAIDKAIEFGRRSIALDPAGAYGAYTLALPYIFRGQLEDAEAVLTRAFAAYPNDPDLMERLGVTYVFEGRFRDGTDLLERILQVDPFHRRSIHAFIARGYLMLRSYDKARNELRLCYAEAPNFRVCYEVGAVFYAETGQLEKARDAVATLRRLDSRFTLATAPTQLPFKNPSDQKRFLDAFEKAGMP